MPRFNINEVDNYGGTGGGGFFGLADDGEVAKVRFMYRDINDVQGYAVHEVEVGGRKRYVNCLRGYNDPLDDCPFCKSGKFQTVRLYIPVYDVEEGKVKLWERGKKFASKLSSLCARYPNLVSYVFEIERHGKRGDQTTTYEIYRVDQDDTTLDDLPEVPTILGGVVLEKSSEEMEAYLANGCFPDDDQVEVKRRDVSRDDSSRVSRRVNSSNRRTPEKF